MSVAQRIRDVNENFLKASRRDANRKHRQEFVKLDLYNPIVYCIQNPIVIILNLKPWR